jgi:type IV fimbrial biogenesis protein FimT
MHASRPTLGTQRATTQYGFTAIELMVVVTLVAILAGLALPNFTPLVERWRVRQATEDLQSTIYLARSEAIKRGGNIVIQANASSDWGSGWHVFFDANANGVQDPCIPADTPNECNLQLSPIPKSIVIGLPDGSSSATVDRWGILTPASMAFEVTPKNKTISDISAARLCVGTGGRISRIKGSESCPV